MEVYKSKYYELHFFPETEILETIALPTTERMTAGEFQQDCLNQVEIMLKYRPKKNLYDTRNMYFPVTPDLQDWLNETIFPVLIQIELTISAIVMSQEMISQLSIEQTMNEPEPAKIMTQYFDNKETAHQWLLSI